jgi:hypothetical protein
MAEQTVGLILTLNFDRALEAAIQIMAHEAHLSIVHEVRELREHARFGVIYLHGYVERPLRRVKAGRHYGTRRPCIHRGC